MKYIYERIRQSIEEAVDTFVLCVHVEDGIRDVRICVPNKRKARVTLRIGLRLRSVIFNKSDRAD